MSVRIETIRFGEVCFTEQEIITFPKGLPGFERLTQFLLMQSEEYQPIKFLQSVEDPAISFPMLSPFILQEDYHLELSGEERAELDLGQTKRALVYCVVTISHDPPEITANLFSPVVINPEKRKAAQLMLLNSGYPIAKKLTESD